MINYQYFVSYHTRSRTGSGEGFGNVVMTRNGKINSSESLEDVKKAIEKTLREDYDDSFNVVILNFQRL